MFAVAALVFVLVMVVLIRALTHRGHRVEPHTEGDDSRQIVWVLAGGVALPALVLIPLFVYTLRLLADIAAPAKVGGTEVVVTGFRWWWDVVYSGEELKEDLRSANEIHIPVGRPVRVLLRSEDVIHSFWVPALHGKLDLVPGKVNYTWIQADSPGVYRGECAEFCGIQHARMQFRVVAHPAEDFAAWLKRYQQPAVRPQDSLAQAGQEVFFRSGCAVCHAVRGTRAVGLIGPDLTHLASRLTLAAGTLPNTRGHLAGWVANPQAIKPGNLMPKVPLRPGELEGLLAYLSQLR